MKYRNHNPIFHGNTGTMIPRPTHLAQLAHGPRQVGKTTLARQLAAQWDGSVRHFDLEDPDDQARLADPAFVLRPLSGLVVLDEIQTWPDLSRFCAYWLIVRILRPVF